jgi:hypothetical protein
MTERANRGDCQRRGIGLAVRGEGAVDKELTLRCQCPEHVGAELPGHAVQCVAHSVVADDLPDAGGEVLVLGADGLGAAELEDLRRVSR